MGVLNKIFFKIGYMSAANPGTACFFALCFTLVCSLGFINLKITVSIFSLCDCRAAHKIYGFQNHREQTSSRPISMNNLAASLESTLCSLYQKMQRMQIMTYLILLIWSCCISYRYII